MQNRDRFKKIYIEISNRCNLDCEFCLKTDRKKRAITKDDFKIILKKIKPYTKYLYFHVLGEPLIHPEINELIDYAVSEDFYVNITTNGYLINNIKTKNIRQINISLHSYNNRYKKSLLDYLNDIFMFTKNNSQNTYINYRLWIKSKYIKEIIEYLESKYNTKIDLFSNNFKLDNNVFINFDNEFIWPENNLENKAYSGMCNALKDHIAILSNGVVTACCLDGGGKINLGNIFVDDIEDIINSQEFRALVNGFKENKRINPLCQKCNFIEIKKID